jgi:hypothetical protein
MKRVIVPELLDSDAGNPAEVQAALADLGRINRWFGGVSTTLALLDRVADRTRLRQLSLLEVASGSADVPRAAVSHLRRREVQLATTSLDRSFSHLDKESGRQALVADACQLPLADNSFDLVSCGLFAHHLEPEDIVRLAREALRVARVAFLVNDLVRSAVHLALVYAGQPLWQSRLTRHDSVASVRRAYTPTELRALIERSGAPAIEVVRHYLFRMGIIAWKHV